MDSLEQLIGYHFDLDNQIHHEVLPTVYSYTRTKLDIYTDIKNLENIFFEIEIDIETFIGY